MHSNQKERKKDRQEERKKERKKTERRQGRSGGPHLPGNLIACRKFPKSEVTFFSC